jgi:hypothetical protein
MAGADRRRPIRRSQRLCLRGELRPAQKTPALDLWQVVLEIFRGPALPWATLMLTDGSSL